MEAEVSQLLNEYLGSKGKNTLPFVESWSLAPYKGGFVFGVTDSGIRSHYFVIDGIVRDFITPYSQVSRGNEEVTLGITGLSQML